MTATQKEEMLKAVKENNLFDWLYDNVADITMDDLFNIAKECSYIIWTLTNAKPNGALVLDELAKQLQCAILV